MDNDIDKRARLDDDGASTRGIQHVRIVREGSWGQCNPDRGCQSQGQKVLDDDQEEVVAERLMTQFRAQEYCPFIRFILI